MVRRGGCRFGGSDEEESGETAGVAEHAEQCVAFRQVLPLGDADRRELSHRPARARGRAGARDDSDASKTPVCERLQGLGRRVERGSGLRSEARADHTDRSSSSSSGSSSKYLVVL